MSDYVLQIKNLHTVFHSRTDGKESKAVNGISFNVERGKILAVVGESGSGKSVTMMSVMRLLGINASVTGEVLLNGTDLLKLSEKEMREIRGGNISMIFQDPMTALNPVYTVGDQLREMIRLHRPDIEDADSYIIELLNTVGISDGKRRLHQYPHELSGGRRQRVMIAMALASDPEVLIADEPTTALDVTVQAQIIDLIKEITVKRNMTTIIITHDLGIVAGLCDNVVVLYGGKVCEQGTVREIFKNPKHEYTKGLIEAVPANKPGKRLVPIEGAPINPNAAPSGCAFCARCKEAMEICLTEYPPEERFSDTHVSRCWMNSLPQNLNYEKEGEADD